MEILTTLLSLLWTFFLGLFDLLIAIFYVYILCKAIQGGLLVDLTHFVDIIIQHLTGSEHPVSRPPHYSSSSTSNDDALPKHDPAVQEHEPEYSQSEQPSTPGSEHSSNSVRGDLTTKSSEHLQDTDSELLVEQHFPIFGTLARSLPEEHSKACWTVLLVLWQFLDTQISLGFRMAGSKSPAKISRSDLHAAELSLQHQKGMLAALTHSINHMVEQNAAEVSALRAQLGGHVVCSTPFFNNDAEQFLQRGDTHAVLRTIRGSLDRLGDIHVR